MFSQFVGYCSIFLGVLWLIWPQILRGWFVGKASRVIFWALLLPVVYPAGVWAGHQWGLGGWAAFVVALVVTGTLLRVGIGRAAGKIPAVYFQMAGVLNIASGLSLLYLKK